MKILIDIGHPAHVHYFKYFIKSMNDKNHQILICARDKEVTHSLLKYYGFKYVSRGKGAKKILFKFFYLIYANYYLYKVSNKFKPDIFLSFGSTYAAQVSAFIGKPHLAFDDTEHATYEHIMYKPFTNKIFTPSSFKKDFGDKHIKFKGYMELSYLHPNYFTPDPNVLNILELSKNERYIIVRFVAWDASHDNNLSGLNLDIKRKCIKILSQHIKVFISSEEILPFDLEKYRINISPEMMHDALYYSSYLFGESGTMTAECAMLGVPAIQISGLPNDTIGTLSHLQNEYKLIKVFEKFDENILKEIINNLDDQSFYNKLKQNRLKMIDENIDVTKLMIEEIERYIS